MKSCFRKRHQRGLTLVEVTVTMFICSVSSIAIALLFAWMTDGRIFRLGTRDQVYFDIRRVVANEKELRFVKSHSPILQQCLSGSDLGLGLVCQSGEYYGLELYDSSGVKIAGPEATGTTPEDPVYYSDSGSICLAGMNCPIKATASFRVQGFPRFGSADHSIPFPSFPNTYKPWLGPELIEIVFSVAVNTPSSTTSIRPLRGSVIFLVNDISW